MKITYIHVIYIFLKKFLVDRKSFSYALLNLASFFRLLTICLVSTICSTQMLTKFVVLMLAAQRWLNIDCMKGDVPHGVNTHGDQRHHQQGGHDHEQPHQGAFLLLLQLSTSAPHCHCCHIYSKLSFVIHQLVSWCSLVQTMDTVYN